MLRVLRTLTMLGHSELLELQHLSSIVRSLQATNAHEISELRCRLNSDMAVDLLLS